MADNAKLDAVLDEIAWCASIVRTKRYGVKAERAVAMVALKLIDSMRFDERKEQEATFEKLLARYERVAEGHSKRIRQSLGLNDDDA